MDFLEVSVDHAALSPPGLGGFSLMKVATVSGTDDLRTATARASTRQLVSTAERSRRTEAAAFLRRRVRT